MLTDPKLTPYYRTFKKTYWESFEDSEWILGRELLTLVWNNQAVDYLKAKFDDQAFIQRLNEKLSPRLKVYGMSINNQKFKGEIVIENKAQFKPEQWLKLNSLKHTLRKTQGGYAYDFIAGTLKKDVVLGLTQAESTVKLSPGTKLNVPDFVRQTFKYERDSDWVRSKITVIGDWTT